MHRSIGKARIARGTNNHFAGSAAEETVSSDYTRRGMPITERRWRGRSGEIDLIADSGDQVVFIEVKKSRSFDRALDRLSNAQVKRLYATVNEYLASKPNGTLTDVRFDVALVNQHGEFKIVENAFA